MYRILQFALISAANMLAAAASAQQVQWLTSTPIDWLRYPTTPGNVVSAR